MDEKLLTRQIEKTDDFDKKASFNQGACFIFLWLYRIK